MILGFTTAGAVCGAISQSHWLVSTLYIPVDSMTTRSTAWLPATEVAQAKSCSMPCRERSKDLVGSSRGGTRSAGPRGLSTAATTRLLSTSSPIHAVLIVNSLLLTICFLS